MSLNLKTLRLRGRTEKLPIPLAVEPLELENLRAATQREASIKAPALERLSSRHRQIAKAVASGATTGEIANRFGMSASRISILKADATFRDLVTFYESMEDDAFQVMHEAMAGLGLDAVEELRTRLEEAPEEIETSELTKLIQTTADRTGHAPKRVEEKNVTFNFGDRLEAARNRAREMIDITPKEAAE